MQEGSDKNEAKFRANDMRTSNFAADSTLGEESCQGRFGSIRRRCISCGDAGGGIPHRTTPADCLAPSLDRHPGAALFVAAVRNDLAREGVGGVLRIGQIHQRALQCHLRVRRVFTIRRRFPQHANQRRQLGNGSDSMDASPRAQMRRLRSGAPRVWRVLRASRHLRRYPSSLTLLLRAAAAKRLHIRVGFLTDAYCQRFGFRAVVACCFQLHPQRADAREALNEIAVRIWLVAQARQYNFRKNSSDQEI
jgi:hypothetical protein